MCRDRCSWWLWNTDNNTVEPESFFRFGKGFGRWRFSFLDCHFPFLQIFVVSQFHLSSVLEVQPGDFPQLRARVGSAQSRRKGWTFQRKCLKFWEPPILSWGQLWIIGFLWISIISYCGNFSRWLLLVGNTWHILAYYLNVSKKKRTAFIAFRKCFQCFFWFGSLLHWQYLAQHWSGVQNPMRVWRPFWWCCNPCYKHQFLGSHHQLGISIVINHSLF